MVPKKTETHATHARKPEPLMIKPVINLDYKDLFEEFVIYTASDDLAHYFNKLPVIIWFL